MQDSRPTAIDFFCGVGGMSLGLEQAGFRVVAANEIEAKHLDAHDLNFPNCARLEGSIEDWHGSKILSETGLAVGEVDIVTGGPPCQGFSYIGRRDETDPRNQLATQFAHRILELQPRSFVMENVPGMLNEPFRAVLDEVVRLLSKQYHVSEPKVLNAADFGVPQLRKRMFLLGARKDVAKTAPVHPTPTHDRTGALGILPATPTVRDAISDLPNVDHATQANRDLRKYGRKAESEYAKIRRGEIEDRGDKSSPPSSWPSADGVSACMRTEHARATVERFAETPEGRVEPKSRLRRLHWDGLSTTLRAGTGPDFGSHTAARPLHPERNRVITVREAARLHSYPDWFRFDATIWHGFRQVGNSVPPALMRAVAQAILDHIGTSKPEAKPASRKTLATTA